MNLNPLKSILKGLVNFTDKEFQIFAEHVNMINLKKGEQWEPVGKVSQMMGFINIGLMREYVLKDGDEYTTTFFMENNFIGNYISYQTAKPSTSYTEALEDCELVVIPFKVFEGLYERLPATKSAADIVGAQKLFNLQDRSTSLLMNTPEERYYKLIDHNPELINRVSQYMIAQYLGIRPESLSRIRKRHLS